MTYATGGFLPGIPSALMGETPSEHSALWRHPVDAFKDLTGLQEADVADLRAFCDEPVLAPDSGMDNVLRNLGIDDPTVVTKAVQVAFTRTLMWGVISSVARRHRLYRSAPRCSKCRTAQVQLLGGLPAHWKCRECGQRFIYEPLIVPKVDEDEDQQER